MPRQAKLLPQQQIWLLFSPFRISDRFKKNTLCQNFVDTNFYMLDNIKAENKADKIFMNCIFLPGK